MKDKINTFYKRKKSEICLDGGHWVLEATHVDKDASGVG